MGWQTALRGTVNYSVSCYIFTQTLSMLTKLQQSPGKQSVLNGNLHCIYFYFVPAQVSRIQADCAMVGRGIIH